MKQFPMLLFIAFFLFSCNCNNEQDKKADIPVVPENKLPNINISVKRYEKALFTIDQKNVQSELKRIQPEYKVFLDGDLNDPQNITQLSSYIDDPVIKDNYDACIKKYPEMISIEKDLSQSLSYYKFWFPERKVPEFYTYVSGGDFNLPIKNMDSVMIIAIDMYLGGDFSFYASCGVPNYKTRWMDKPYIVRDCMEELGIVVCSSDKKDGNFLDQMVSMGKLMYFLDVTMPETPDSIKIKYTGKWLDWCQKNDGNIWSFFIDNKVLYSKDRNTFMKFFSDGPFTTSFGKESPPRIAIWVGWQIVRAYMKQVKDADIVKLIKETDSQKILQVSKYKPIKK